MEIETRSPAHVSMMAFISAGILRRQICRRPSPRSPQPRGSRWDFRPRACAVIGGYIAGGIEIDIDFAQKTGLCLFDAGLEIFRLHLRRVGIGTATTGDEKNGYWNDFEEMS